MQNSCVFCLAFFAMERTSLVFCDRCERNIPEEESWNHSVNHQILKQSMCFVCNIWVPRMARHNCETGHIRALAKNGAARDSGKITYISSSNLIRGFY
jgi:hypothetical protein